MSYNSLVLHNWQQFRALLDEPVTASTCVDGDSLTLARITAIARYDKHIAIPETCWGRVIQSAESVKQRLKDGEVIYGINTGVGGSANTRTEAVDDLQQAIIQHLNCGILDNTGTNVQGRGGPAPLRELESGMSLPLAWVKAAQVVRINSLVGGNSGVRPQVLEALVKLLHANIIPNVPLRSSISASGDLSPLSYIAGAIQGDPGVFVWVDSPNGKVLKDSRSALEDAGIPAVRFAHKEALAVVNGTSVSAGAAALALHEAHGAMILAQVLTAMAVEALNGTTESFDAHFAKVRPHRGQQSVAGNVRHFLKGSQLVRGRHSDNVDGLRQDRYSLRTTAQWMGPEIENMALAHEQLAVECNSITDNPLVKDDGSVVHGGNFQAQSVTAAMDKVRTALHSVGCMLFKQFTELMNPTMNNGLPPNLTADEPSRDFLCKGLDIACAAYQAELGFLAHGTTPFHMVAEVGNQSLNSMALMSARYTHQAVDLVMLLGANAIFALCQALDLRAIQHQFFTSLEPVFTSTLPPLTGAGVAASKPATLPSEAIWHAFQRSFHQNTTLDRVDQFTAAMVAAKTAAIEIAYTSRSQTELPPHVYADIQQWSESMTAKALASYQRIIEEHTPDKTLSLIGAGSQRIFKFVRNDLNIPFLRQDGADPINNMPNFHGVEPGTLIGTFASRIYGALRDSSLLVPVMESLASVAEPNGHIAAETNGHAAVETNGNITAKTNGHIFAKPNGSIHY